MINGRTLYRDTANAKLAGVAAGIADSYGWKIKHVRIAWIILTILYPPVMIGIYLLMTWLVDPKPEAVSAKPRDEFEVQMKMHLSEADKAATTTRGTFANVRDRFSKLEQRLRDLESAVTSREFQIDRELRRSP